jgi:hypothetical protein
VCIRPNPAIGVYRQEKIGLDAPGFLDAHLQGHKEIRIAGQHSTHVGFGIDPRFQTTRNFKRDVFS